MIKNIVFVIAFAAFVMFMFLLQLANVHYWGYQSVVLNNGWLGLSTTSAICLALLMLALIMWFSYKAWRHEVSHEITTA